MNERKSKLHFSRVQIKFFIWSTLFISILCVVLGTVSCISYKNDMYERYFEYGSGFIKLCTQRLDGDDIRQCIETGTMSDKLRNGLDLMNMIKEKSKASYYYVVYFPENSTEKDMRYVLYANTQEDRDEGIADSMINAECGDEYTIECKKAFFNAQNKNGQNAEYIVNMYQGVGQEEHVMTVYQAIADSTGKNICVIGTDIYISLIHDNIKNTLIKIIFTGLLMLIICLTVFQGIINKDIIGPLLKLEESTKDFIEQTRNEENPAKLNFRSVKVESNTELRDFAMEMDKMTGQMKEYMLNLKNVTAEKERIGAELNVATQIQADMLPCIFPPFPDRKEIDIFATMIPAKEVGGDFYDFFMVDESHLAMVMADVSGKGVPAALFMVIGKTLIKDHTRVNASLGEVFMDVNHLLCESNQEGLFITAFEAVLDLKTGDLSYVNAGHEKPYIQHAGGEYVPYNTDPGFVLALMDGMDYEAGSMKLGPGDRIFLHTDGVTEATNANECLYGSERLTETLNRYKDKNPCELLTLVKEDVDKFVGEAPQFDDLTMLCMEYKMKMESTI